MYSQKEFFHISKIHKVVYYAPSRTGQFVYPGVLPTYELMYYVEGETRIKFDGESFAMKPGDLLYLPKGIEGAKYILSSEGPFAIYNIYFDCEDVMPTRPIQIHGKSEEFKWLYEKSYREWFAKREGYYYRILQNIYRILELAGKQQLQYNTKKKFTYLQPAEEYMTSHYCDTDFDYDRMHRLTGLSYSYFKKLFIDKYGIPPLKHITHLRLNRACELLQTGMFQVSQVAEMCGYDNVYYFSNVFKKYMGVSPKQYKE